MGDDGEKEPKASKSRESDNDTRMDSESDSRSLASISSAGVKEPAELKLNPSVPHVPIKKTEKKKVERKKPRRVANRVEKRKPTRRAKRKPRARLPRARLPSTSTIYARGRSESALRESAAQICKHCGHRCCLRRYQYEKRQYQKAKGKRNKARKADLRITSVASQPSCSAGVSIASMDKITGITPEIIYQALRELCMWRQGVPTLAIFDYIRSNHPVNPNPEEVMAELLEKLQIASVSGIIWAVPNDCWRLTTAIEKINRLEQSHVTIFWKIYADTLKPLDRKRALQLKRSDKETNTNTSQQQIIGYSEDLI